MDEWSNTTWQWRHRWRLKQHEAAAWANVSLSTWQRWEQGRTEPRAEEARRVIALMLQYEAHRAQRQVAGDVASSWPAADRASWPS